MKRGTVRRRNPSVRRYPIGNTALFNSLQEFRMKRFLDEKSKL
jgi:hypothetical protein